MFIYFSPAESRLSDDGSDDEDEDERPSFAFPELDAQIRAAVAEYGAVFPKLNFSSPRVRHLVFFRYSFSEASALQLNLV